MSKHTVGTKKQTHFAQAVHANIQRSTFPRGHTLKTTFNAGKLIPLHVCEVLPGDTIKMSLKHLIRLTTPHSPTMDNLDIDFYAYYGPSRILWDGWEELQGENKTGAWTPSEPPALVPQFGTGIISSRSLGDYLGLPVGLDLSRFPVSQLPFRMYAEVWNDWFRDQNLQAPIIIEKGNGEPIAGEYLPNSALLPVNKKHDYFTSCLPAPQKGESALIPIELKDLIPVITSTDIADGRTGNALRWTNVSDGSEMAGGNTIVGLTAGNNNTAAYDMTLPLNKGNIKPRNLFADGRNLQINATTIHELRTAFQMQKLFERDARGGTRYVEMLKAHFGVDAQDYRLQRPELLGHFHSKMGIQAVPQTSSTDSVSPQGNLGGFGYSVNAGHFFNKSFVEHGYLMIFVVARQRKTYQQGLARMWSRRDRFDFYMPALAHISEQPVYKKELYALGTKAQGEEVFGYNEAWADYRYQPNQVTGGMRSGVPNSYDVWHYADFYDSLPYLSADWMKDNSEQNLQRTLSLDASIADQLLMDIVFETVATRPMPVHSVPGLVDHF